MTTKDIYVVAIIICSLLSGACSKNKQPEPLPSPDLPETAFTFEVDLLKPNSAEITITPSSNSQTWYWCRATDKEFVASGNDKDKMLEMNLMNDIQYGIEEEGLDLKEAVEYISHVGTFTNTLQSLFGSTTYHLLAAAIDSQGNPVSEVAEYTFETMKTPVSLNTFTIQIPEDGISYDSASVSIQTTNMDPYTWFLANTNQGTPEILAESYIEEMGEMLNTGYYDIYTGTQSYSFPKMLEPDTDYTVVVFGYEAGRTTSIESAFFKTKPAGDPSKATFQFEIAPEKLTSRGAEVTFTPSDHSVLYWFDILPAEAFSIYESSEEAVNAYLEEIFGTYGEEGYSREDIVLGFCERGVVTISYGPEKPGGALTPDTGYIPFAVCMNLDGTKAGSVFTGNKFTTRQAVTSPAWARTKMITYYDCDELASVYPDFGSFAGQDLLALDLHTEHSADAVHWYLLCVSADYTDPDEFPEEELLATVLSNVATEVTVKDENNPLILFPANRQGTLLTIAEDADGNFSRIERIKIGPLSKDGASPVPSSVSRVEIPMARLKTCMNKQSHNGRMKLQIAPLSPIICPWMYASGKSS